MNARRLLPMENLVRAAPVLRVAAHPIRLRILDLLRDGPMRVGDIAKGAGCPQAVASQHLAILRQHRILASDRKGQCVFYRLVRPELLSLLECIGEHCRLGDEPADPGDR